MSDTALSETDVNAIKRMMDEWTTALAKKIRAQLVGEDPSRRYLQALCIALLVEMFRPVAEGRTRNPRRRLDQKRLQLLLKYVDANLDGDLTVERLADLVGVTGDQLSRSFKRSVGESPYNYVIQRRTDAARLLLENDDYTLADIAYATGFSSQSHMTTTFKKVLGVTPGAVRREKPPNHGITGPD